MKKNISVKRFFLSLIILMLVAVTIGSATAGVSTISFTEYPSNPVFDPSAKAYYPSILYDANGFGDDTIHYKMWFGSDSGVGYAYSNDGKTWTAGTNPVTGLMTKANHPLVEYYQNGFSCVGGVTCYYRMWYGNYENILYSINSIRYAESVDGINWINDQAITGNIISGVAGEWNGGSYGPIDVIYNPTATNTGTNPFDYSFVMYFDATTGGFEEIGLGYSSDAKNWQLYGKVLPKGNAGAWDSSYATFGTVIKESGSKWHMWYSGGQTDSNDGIGYATSSDGINWTKDANNPIFHQNDGMSWRNDRTYTPQVIYDPSKFSSHGDSWEYKMWFSGKDTATGNYAVGYAYYAPTPTTVYVNSAYTESSAGSHIFGYDAFSTIQEGINAVASSGTVNVAAGTYDVISPIIVNKPVIISGPNLGIAKVEGTTIDAIRVFDVQSSDVTIQNLEITTGIFTTAPAPAEVNDSLIAVTGGPGLSNINIKNNKLYVPLQSGPMSGWVARAITVSDSVGTGIVITGNTIYNTRNGIVVRSNNAATITNNVVFNTKGGIMDYTANQVDADNRLITGNSWTSTVSGIINHNEWDIVWNTFAYFVPDYQQSVVAVSLNNNGAYVLDRRAADAAACANLIGNRNHIFVDASSSINTANPAKGNFNEPFSSIRLAIDAVVSGGTIEVAAGTYEEGVVINKAITLNGAQAGNDARTRTGDETIIRPTATPTNNGAVIYISADDVTVDGLEIDGTTVAKNGIYGWDTSGLAVQNNKIHGATNSWDGCGISLISWGNSGTVHHNTIKKNVVYDTGRMGIMVMDHSASAYTITSDNEISNNKVYDTWKMGQEWDDHGGAIQINGAKNSQITNNEVYNTGLENPEGTCSGGVTDQTICTALKYRGIYLSGSSTGNVISGNKLYNNFVGITIAIDASDKNGQGSDWWVDYGGNDVAAPTISNNQIYDNTYYGVLNRAPYYDDGTPDDGHGTFTINAENNYWGSKTPVFTSIISGTVDHTPWYIDSGLTMLISEAPGEGQALADSENVTVGEGKTDIVIPAGSPVQNIDIPTDVDDDTQVTLDLSSSVINTGTEKTVTLANDLTLSRDTSTAIDYEVEIPAGTIISGPTDWTGVINVPTVKATSSVTPTADAGTTASVATVVEVGFGDTKLTFNNAVRLLITGQAGKLAGYSRGGVFTKITTTCTDDTQATNDLLPADTECKIDVGSDMVIWTKHFTTFAAYTQASIPPASTGGSGASFPGTSKKTTPTPSAVKVPTPAAPVQNTQQVPIEQPTIQTEEETTAPIPTGQTVSELPTTGGATMKMVLLIIGLVLIVTLSIWMVSRRGRA